MLNSYTIDNVPLKNPSNDRENFIMGFIGHNRTGKTSIAKKYACEWKASRPEGFVVAFDPQDVFKKTMVTVKDTEIPLVDNEIMLYEQGDWYEKILQYNNALLILDDYRMLHPKSNPEKGWLKLLALRNKKNIDIIYIVHTPSLILNILTGYTTHYFLFYTMAQNGSFEKKIPHYQMCMAASIYVNKYVKTFGKGRYPNFPYIVVDTLNETLTAQNIDTKFINIPKNFKYKQNEFE